MRMDLNVDAGEGMLWRGRPLERVLFPWITSVNIACGGHVGDRDSMDQCLALAKEHGVTIGAHPSFADRSGFGRRAVNLSKTELSALIDEQLGCLEDRARRLGLTLRHLKPHGALYHLASVDRLAASVIAGCASRFSPSLVLIGCPGGALETAAREHKIPFLGEGFPDRGYTVDGSLVRRVDRGALIRDPKRVVERALHMVRHQRVRVIEGFWLPLRVETLCLHGDLPGVVARARRLRNRLEEAGVEVLSYNHE